MLNDLKIGKEGEEAVVKILESKGLPAQISKGKFLYYDINCYKDNFTLEVKNDIYAKKSGNIAIEVLNSKSNTASGLTATKANLWVHIACDVIYVANTEMLREYVNKNSPLKYIDAGGDDNATLLIYKMDNILQEPLFFQLAQLTKKEIKKLCQKK